MDQVALSDILSENRGLSLENLKKRCPGYENLTVRPGGGSDDDWYSPVITQKEVEAKKVEVDKEAAEASKEAAVAKGEADKASAIEADCNEAL